MSGADGQVVNGWLAAIAVLAPLVLSAGVLAPWTRRAASAAAPLAALPALWLALFGGGEWIVDVPWLMLGTRVGLDLTGRVFLLLASVIFSVATMAAVGDPEVKAGGRPRFLAFFLLCASGAFGLALARDVVTFYTSFALMSFPAYGLVVHDRRAESLRAGRVYIAFVIVGEVLLVSGLFVAVWAAGSIDLAVMPERIAWSRTVLVAVPIILVAFGIKAAAVPLHVWQPPAYTHAPVPAAAALAGAMSTAGVVGWLRFLPLGTISLPGSGLASLGAGLLAMFYGVLVGLTQREPKTVLAYSSVSQMGFMTASVGLGLLVPSSWPVLLVAVLAYALHHGLAKGALFLGAGAGGAVAGPGYRRGAAILVLGLGLCSLSLAGAPLTSGALAKVLVKEGFASTGIPSIGSVIGLMSLAAVGTTVLMARFLALVWQQVRAPEAAARAAGAGGRLGPWILATAVSLLSPWLLLRELADPARALTLATAWPVVVGVVIGAAAIAAANRGWRPRLPQVPAGDLLVVVERVAGSVVAGGLAVGRASARLTRVVAGLAGSRAGTRDASAASYVESRVAAWSAFGWLFVGLLVAVVLFLVLTGTP